MDQWDARRRCVTEEFPCDMFFFPDEVCPVFHGFLIGGVEHFFPYIGNSQPN
jgi:hypothetical protein